MDTWISSSLVTVGWVVVGTALVYLTTLAAVRLAGRRTVAQLSAFDAIITVALGSLLATTAVSSSTSYLEGAAALLTLLALQVLLAMLRTRFDLVRRLVDFRPEVVAHGGDVDLPTAPWTAQLSRGEVESLLREHGRGDLDERTVVVLEPTGNVSVLRSTDGEIPHPLP